MSDTQVERKIYLNAMEGSVRVLPKNACCTVESCIEAIDASVLTLVFAMDTCATMPRAGTSAIQSVQFFKVDLATI